MKVIPIKVKERNKWLSGRKCRKIKSREKLVLKASHWSVMTSFLEMVVMNILMTMMKVTIAMIIQVMMMKTIDVFIELCLYHNFKGRLITVLRL